MYTSEDLTPYVAIARTNALAEQIVTYMDVLPPECECEDDTLPHREER